MQNSSVTLTKKSSALTQLALIVVLGAALTACQPARYITHPSSNSGINQGAGNTEAGIKDFETKVVLHTGVPAPVDITWMIDNSGSMAQEAAHVRANFQSFINSVQLEADLKVALISRVGDAGTAVRLPNPGANAIQLDRLVWSTDSLQILASAICPNPAPAGSACATIRSSSVNDITDIAGQLSPFLRPNARQAFVFVTDDNSAIASSQFMTAFKEVYPNSKPAMYGFIGLDAATSPCMDSAGTEYAKLAKETGGTMYNICEADWTEAFKKLATNVVRLAYAPVVVPADLLQGAELLTVSVNGNDLKAEDYSLTPDGLFIDPSITKGLGEVTVYVRYKVKTP